MFNFIIEMIAWNSIDTELPFDFNLNRELKWKFAIVLNDAEKKN